VLLYLDEDGTATCSMHCQVEKAMRGICSWIADQGTFPLLTVLYNAAASSCNARAPQPLVECRERNKCQPFKMPTASADQSVGLSGYQ